MKAYKIFNKDLKCRDFQYEIGRTYEHHGNIELCEEGFHACIDFNDCLRYYNKYDLDNNTNRICEVEMNGDIINGKNKSVSSEITILKEITWEEAIELFSDEHRNLGINNTGNRNIGRYNKGNNNTGNYNIGKYNKGNWNKGNNNKGNDNEGNCNEGNCNEGNDNTGNCNEGNDNKGNWNNREL